MNVLSGKKPAPRQPESLRLKIQRLEECSDSVFCQELLFEFEWAKSDFSHFVKVLNRIDSVYEKIIKEYFVPNQIRPLESHDQRFLVNSLKFSGMLWEHCTNKSIYNSYDVIYY
jgi:E3 ubiquitin-protein ligase HUWE1